MIKLNSTALRALTVSVAMTAIHGCSTLNYAESEYSCKGRPDGITCVDVVGMYEMTNGDDYKERIEAARVKSAADLEAREAGQGASDQAMVERQSSDAQQHMAFAPVEPGVRGVVPQNVQGIVPLRTPAKVMRIYIRPYETKEGDLYVPGYAYTEIEERKWMIGDKAVSNADRITILDNESRASMTGPRSPRAEHPRGVGSGKTIPEILKEAQ